MRNFRDSTLLLSLAALLIGPLACSSDPAPTQGLPDGSLPDVIPNPPGPEGGLPDSRPFRDVEDPRDGDRPPRDGGPGPFDVGIDSDFPPRDGGLDGRPPREGGPGPFDGGTGLDTFVPSDAGGTEGIAVSIKLPATARYSGRAPVVVIVQGGWGNTGMDANMPVEDYGLIGVRFNFPGGGTAPTKSGGTYDMRGDNCQRALRDVVKFISGKINDKSGKSFASYVTGMTADTGNIGLVGLSNGGNATLVSTGLYGDEMDVAWIVNWESPVGDGNPTVELGGKDTGTNPAYDPTTGALDYSKLKYASDINVAGRGAPAVLGGFYWDLNDNGKWDQGSDFGLTPLFDADGKYAYYSVRTSAYVSISSLMPASPPSHLRDQSQTSEFWQTRNGEYYVEDIVKKRPNLMFIIEAATTDHVQVAPDHPHVFMQYDLFQAHKAKLTRLNPDKSYVDFVAGRAIPGAVDNDANKVFGRTDMAKAVQPDTVSNRVGVSAAVLELADRTEKKDYSVNLTDVLVK